MKRKAPVRPARLAAILVISLCMLASPSAVQSGIFGDMSVKEERELGRKFDYLLRTEAPLVEDPVIIAYVRELVAHLEQALPPKPWKVQSQVMVSNQLNAFAGPAGLMYVYTGLIAHLEHESDLAGVIAHELGHVSARHVAQNVGNAKRVGILSMLGSLAGIVLGGSGGQGLATASQAAGQSAMLSYSRDNEHEADDLGLNYLIESGFQPMGLVRAFETLKRRSFNRGSAIPSYLSTHPGLNERIGYLTARISSLPAAIRDRGEADAQFKRIQTLVRGRYVDDTLALSFFQDVAPDDCLGLMGRGIALERNGRSSESSAVFDQLMQCNDSDPLFLREAGRNAFTNGDFKSAGQLLQKAVTLDPGDMMSLYFLSRIMADTGDLPNAIAAMERVAKSHPMDAEVRDYLGRMNGKAGNLFQAHLNLAYAALYKGDLKRAERSAEQARQYATTTRHTQDLDELNKLREEYKELKL